MKTKNILKKDAATFCKNAAVIAARLGFQELTPGQIGDLRIQTDCGIYVLHLPTMNCWFPSSLISINGYFKEAARAAKQVECNPYSGKWNLLHSDPDMVLLAFESRMRSVNAHAPTPEELEAWAIADAEHVRKMAVWRGEMNKILPPELAFP